MNRQRKLKQGYDIMQDTVKALKEKLNTEQGNYDYKTVQFLAAAYTIKDYFAIELSQYNDDEYEDYLIEQEETEV